MDSVSGENEWCTAQGNTKHFIQLVDNLAVQFEGLDGSLLWLARSGRVPHIFLDYIKLELWIALSILTF